MGAAQAVSFGLSYLSSAAGSVSDYQQARAEERLGEKRQELAYDQAKIVKRRAKDEARRLREQGEELMGSQRAAIGASGLQQAGSAGAVVRDTERKIERDYERILQRGREEAKLLRKQGDIYAAAGKPSGDRWGMGDTLLTRVPGSRFAQALMRLP